MSSLVHSREDALIPTEGEVASVDNRLLPVRATEQMLMAARGLLLAREMNVPNLGYSLGEVARSGYYGKHWRHILTDEERAIEAPLTKGHLADLIWRAMVAAAPTALGASADPTAGGYEGEAGVNPNQEADQ